MTPLPSDADRSQAGRNGDDAVFSALADHRRREVIRYFLETDATVAPIDDLVEFVAGRDPQAAERERIQLELHHVTVPALSEAGFLE